MKDLDIHLDNTGSKILFIKDPIQTWMTSLKLRENLNEDLTTQIPTLTRHIGTHRSLLTACYPLAPALNHPTAQLSHLWVTWQRGVGLTCQILAVLYQHEESRTRSAQHRSTKNCFTTQTHRTWGFVACGLAEQQLSKNSLEAVLC